MKIRFLLILATLLLFRTPGAYSQISRNFLKEQKPKWEAGIGLATLSSPDYPGAEKNTLRFLPIPFFIYRGDFLRMDDEGTRARVRSEKNWELGLSGGFNFALDSNETLARKGMNDLDALVEGGPRFLYRFFTNSKTQQLNLGLSLRGAFSTNFSNRWRWEGIAIVPQANYWISMLETGLTFFTGVTLKFGDKGLNQFFYQVDSQFVTSNRSAYEARAGLMRATATLGGLQVISKTLSVFAGVFVGNQSLSANRESPLIERQTNIGGSFGLIWNFYQSDETASDAK